MISYKLPSNILRSFLTLEVDSNALIITSGEFFITLSYNEITWQYYESSKSTGQHHLLDIKPFYTSVPKDHEHETMSKIFNRDSGFEFDTLFRMPRNEFGFVAVRVYRAGVSEDSMGRLFALDGITFLHENELAIQIEETQVGLQADIIRIEGVV